MYKNRKIICKHCSTYGLALFLFLTPFEYPLADMVSTSPLRIVGLFAMVLAFLDVVRSGHIREGYRFGFIACWIFYGAVTYLWAKDIGRFNTYYSLYFNNAIMFLLFSIIDYSKKESEILKKALVYGVGMLLIYMTFVPNATMYSPYQHRLTLNAGKDGLDQNYLAALMVMAFGIVVYKLCNEKEILRKRLINLLFCGAVAYYILLTGSRSGLIACVLIILLSMNTTLKNRLYIGILALIIIFIGVPIILKYVPEEIIARYSLSAFTGQEAESGTRIIIWKRAIESMEGITWLFGHGIGASQFIIGDVLGLGKNMAIHNHYIAMLVETGMLGLFLVVYPMIRMVVFLWKHERGISIAFMGIVVMTFFIDVMTTKFFWSTMILMSTCCSCYKENKKRIKGITYESGNINIS